MVLKRYVVGPAVNRVFEPQVEGLDNIPVTGAAILASNHLSFADSVFMPVGVPRQVYFLAKSEYFSGKGVRGRATAAFFKGINQIPMDRSGGNKSAASLSVAAQTLQDGHLLGIYPEGTRSPDGRLYRAKLGVARLALETKAPVIPVAMINTEKVQPMGCKLPRRCGQDGKRLSPVRTVIGKPLDFSRYYDQSMTHAVQRAVADEIIQAIQKLSGQEYVDVYASSVKSLMEKQRINDAKAAVAELVDKAKERAQTSVASATSNIAPAAEKAKGKMDEAIAEVRAKVEERFKEKNSALEDGSDKGASNPDEESSHKG